MREEDWVKGSLKLAMKGRKRFVGEKNNVMCWWRLQIFLPSWNLPQPKTNVWVPHPCPLLNS